MKRILAVILLVLCFAMNAHAGPLTGKTWVFQSTDCSAFIIEGVVCWDTDDDILYVGNGAAAKAIASIDSPTFTTQITTPLIYGSSAANGDITIEGTSSGTKTTSYVILQPTAGNVGIGVTSPLASLDIAGYEPLRVVHGSKISVDGQPAIRFLTTGLDAGGDTGNWSLVWSSSVSNPTYTFIGDTTTGIFQSALGAIGFSTTGTEAMTIKSGNVGIGTTSPNRKLSVWNGDAEIQNSGTLGSESLTDGNFTATTKWADANDFHLAGGITTVTLAGGGAGYTALDVLTVVQAGGAGGTIRVDTVDGSGVILTFTVTAGGTSYYVANSLSVTGGTGSAATFNITVISNIQARYVHSTNAGTLTQTSGNLAVAVRANRWYKLVYPVSTVTAGCTAVLTTGVAATQQTLTITAGTQTLYFLSAASPGNFVISVTSTAGGFTLDDLSLKEVQGGDIYLGGDLYVGNHLTTTGAGAGTLTNAPTAGNPTVYIKIKVGGTYYAVPGWALP